MSNQTRHLRDWQLQTIGLVKSCYKEKFGIPRQANLVTEAKGEIHLLPDYQQEGILRGLESFSHLWLTFIFHETIERGWKPTVRPPRLGGNQRMGVFASRSTHRPNPIGLSVVKLDRIDIQSQQWIIHYSGGDLLDGTPIVDIKPYLTYADSIQHANSSYAQIKPIILPVRFSNAAKQQCEQQQSQLTQENDINLFKLIEQILQQDPRPAYQQSHSVDRIYAMKLFSFNLRWRYDHHGIEVIDLRTCSSSQ